MGLSVRSSGLVAEIDPGTGVVQRLLAPMSGPILEEQRRG